MTPTMLTLTTRAALRGPLHLHCAECGTAEGPDRETRYLCGDDMDAWEVCALCRAPLCDTCSVENLHTCEAGEARALAALRRITRGGPWQPGEREALNKIVGDWITSDPE